MAKYQGAAIRKAAQRQGWRVEPTKKGWLLIPPDKTKPAVTMHNTPSDHRAEKNLIATLRRSGLVWPPKED